jgi:hypothetical protein
MDVSHLKKPSKAIEEIWPHSLENPEPSPSPGLPSLAVTCTYLRLVTLNYTFSARESSPWLIIYNRPNILLREGGYMNAKIPSPNAPTHSVPLLSEAGPVTSNRREVPILHPSSSILLPRLFAPIRG